MRCDPVLFYALGVATIPAVALAALVAIGFWEEFGVRLRAIAREWGVGMVGVGAIIALLVWAPSVRPPPLPRFPLIVGPVSGTMVFFSTGTGSSTVCFPAHTVTIYSGDSYTVGPGQEMTITTPVNR